MNGFPAAATPSPPTPPPNPTTETSRPATCPEYSSFKFKTLGQPPTLLSRFSDAGAASVYRSPSPEQYDMDITSSEDPTIMVTEDHRTFHPAPRKTLLDMLGGHVDYQGHSPRTSVTQTQDPGALESIDIPSLSTSPPKPVLPRPESRLSSISRQLSTAADITRADIVSFQTSVASETHTYEPPDSDMIDLYADPDSPSQSPLSLFSDLSEVVRESAELDRIISLQQLYTAEREELLTRYEEIGRAESRAKAQLRRVLSISDETVQTMTVLVGKEKARLETKKTNAEAKIERRKNLEAAEQRRKAKELERIRQYEERKVQAEVEQAERHRLEEQRRKEEALAAEKQHQEEIQARERAQAEERRKLEEERQRLAEEEDRRRRDEEERKRQAEEKQQEEEERLRRLAEEREALARKQEEDRRTQLLERRKLAEEERKRKEAEAAAAKAEAEKQAAEREQQRIFQERRATVLKDKYRNYNRSELGAPPTGSSSTLEGTSGSDLPSITANDNPTNPQVLAELYPGLAKTYKARDTPTFVPATTEAGRLPPDLSQQVKVSDDLIDYTVKHETTSPVITPVDNDQLIEYTPPAQLPSRPVSSMSTPAPTPAPTPLPALPHLPAKPVTIYSHPPIPLQQRVQSPRRYPPRRSRSRSRSSSRSPRRESPISRIPSRTSRSPDTARGRYQSPPTTRRGDHYSPPRPAYRDGGSRYNRNGRSDSPPPPPQNSLKRTLQDSWAGAGAPSKLDYSHPAKRRAASPLRSRSPPSPRLRPLTHPPPVVSARRPPPPSRRGRGGGPSSHVPLEQRLSRPPQLSDRITMR